MALAEAAKLIATLDLGGNFVKNLGGADRALGKFDAHIDRSQSKAFQAGQHIGTGIKAGAAIAAAGIGLIATNVALGLNSLVELEQQQAQTNAVLKSTKGAAGISAQAVSDLAEKYESLNAVIGDEVIRSTENMLLTFTNIKGKAFEPALQAILDINTAMGKGPEGLQQTAIQVGKALNDPTKGLTALTRIGVTFDKGQVKRIKQLQKEGKVYEAQQIILAELNREFGGSFLAQGNTTAGKVAKFTDSIEDLQRALAEALLPTLGNVADALSTFLRDPKTVEGIRKLGQNIAKFFTPENIAKGISLLKGAVSAIASIAGPVLSVLREAISLFQKMPPWAQKLIIGGFLLNKATGGGVTNVGGSLADSIAKGIATGISSAVGGSILRSILGGGASAAAGTASAAETTTILGSLARLLGGSIVLPVTVSAITVAAAGAIANAIDPTSNAPGATPLSNRDPRRFDEFGRVIRNSLEPVKTIAADIHSLIAGGGGADRHGTPGIPAAVHDKETEAAIESLRGQLTGADRGAGQSPATETHGRLLDATTEALRAVDIARSTDIEALRSTVYTGLAGLDALFAPGIKLDASQITDLRASTDKTGTAVDAMHGDLSQGLQVVGTNTTSVENAVKAADQQISSSGQLVQGAAALAGYRAASATNAAASGIESTIRANRPIIDVQVNISATSVEKTVVVNDRNGPSGGSATDDLGYPGHPGR